jgi:RHS repeat-associated protein
MRTVRNYFFILLFLVTTIHLRAGIEQVITSRCGKSGFTPITAIATGVSMSISDQWYSYMIGHAYSSGDPTSWDQIFRVNSAVTKVSLRYDDSRHYAPTSAWALRVTYDIVSYDSVGTTTTTTGEKLLITYDPAEGITYTDQATRTYLNSHHATIGIRNVEYFADGDLSHSSTSTIPANLADIYLELENDVERYYFLDATAPRIYQHPGDDESSISLGWNYILGAESYDVEWLFIDAGQQSLTASPGFDFDWKNATRVNVPGNHYTIELAYPRGILLMRVRPVGIDVPNFMTTGYAVRTEGTWSYNYEVGNTYSDASLISAAYARLTGDLSGRETALNWQYSASYAEGGKVKEGIGFYDGALYNRQSLTRSNSDTNLIVAESRCDYEGRAAVNILPTPVSIDGSHLDALKYQTDFNPNFNASDFDIDGAVGNAPRMDTVNDASAAFYSGSNAGTDRGKPYTATANGYAYTQIHYKNDGTNRISSQSGIGENFRQGSGREIKYFYGTPTGQVELDRLFGNEVGYVKHYQKDLVEDPNGQVAVSYLDQDGRVIATALAGNVPDNLIQLDNEDESEQNLTADLLGNNSLDQSNRMVSSTTITASGSTTFNFSYDLDADTACAGCLDHYMCQDCKYDLTISVFDEDNNLVTPTSGSNPVTATNITSGSYTFEMTLPVGVYRVEKVLSLNEENLATVRQYFIDHQACVSTTTATAEPCALDCHSACEALYKKEIESTWHYYDANGDEITSNDGEGHTPSQQAQTLIDACEAQMCDAPSTPDPCSLKWNNMLIDMAPGGQYFDNTPDKWTVDMNGDMIPTDHYYSYTDGSGFHSGHINDWLLSNSTRSADMLAAINAVWSGTDFTLWDDVRNNWDTSWARILVEWHPEYCTWNYYCNHDCTAHSNFPAPGGADVTFHEDAFHDYDEAFFHSTDGNYPTTTTTVLELFNPVNAPSSTTNNGHDHDNHLYQPNSASIDVTYLDPWFNCDFSVCSSGDSSALWRIQSYLENYLPVYDGSNSFIGYHSIWYVLEDPDGIASGNNSGLSSATIDFYVALHGDGSSVDGILTDGGGDITPFQFFAGAYGYYRQLVIDQGFLASSSVATCQDDHSGSAYGYLAADPDHGSVTADGFNIYFPENPVLATHPSGCSAISFGVPDNMDDYVDGLSTTYDVEGNTIDATYSQAACSCENLQGFITENDLSPTDYSAIATALNNILDGATYTSTQVQDWLTTCGEETYTMSDLDDNGFPTDLACSSGTSTVDVDNVNELLQEECGQENDALANMNTDAINAAAVDEAVNTYMNLFIKSCLNKLANKESFLVDYTLKEYHYTLYYYDQAGNLVKTVPPDGVNIITSPTTLGHVADYRAGTYATFTPAVHDMVTKYKYNSMQHPTEQISPDETAETKFYYDYLGRIVVSQNARQADVSIFSNPAYSYTLYDHLGRACESGQVETSTAIPTDLVGDTSALRTWLATGTKKQVVYTQYDTPLSGIAANFPDGEQHNIRGRVASVVYEAVDDADYTTWDNGYHYSYDIHGNVNVLLQDNGGLSGGVIGFKTTTYEYDLVSGNVNAVHYDVGGTGEFHHRYEYDADNRVTCAYTSRDGVIWQKEEKNFYYATGPLFRMEIGDKIVQAEDYAYTAQGWIKGMNSGTISATRDIGKDSYSEYISGMSSQNRDVALDAAGFVLGYYDGGTGIKADYWSPAFASGGWAARFTPDVTSTYTQADYNPLYNGNISRMITALTNTSQSPVTEQLTAYQYDQLNRIKQVRAHRNYNSTDNAFEGATGDDGSYHEDFSYDGNGNILTVLRNGNNAGATQEMDDMGYNYISGTNKLDYVRDGVLSTNYTTDIDGQYTGNYNYDPIGNLKSDVSEQIDNIDWTVNGKIHTITRTGSSTKSDLEFVYDPMGNRIVKITKPRDGSGVESELHWTYTYYVRDGQGNVLAVYTRTFEDTHADNKYNEVLKLSELDIYGSRRVGVVYDDSTTVRTFTDAGFTDADGNVFTPDSYDAGSSPVADNLYTRTLGKKAYEIANHLGNVLETVSDRRQNVDNYSYAAWSGGTKYAYDATRNAYYQSTTGTYQRNAASSDGKVDWYTADVRSYSDYYAFGAQMDGRFSGDYRYGFNGTEYDPEDLFNTTDFRQYDSRLGRWLTTDPVVKPWESPYAGFANNPIYFNDPSGLNPGGGDGDKKPDTSTPISNPQPGDTYNGATYDGDMQAWVLPEHTVHPNDQAQFIADNPYYKADLLAEQRYNNMFSFNNDYDPLGWLDRVTAPNQYDPSEARLQKTNLHGDQYTSDHPNHLGGLGGFPDRMSDGNYLPGSIAGKSESVIPEKVFGRPTPIDWTNNLVYNAAKLGQENNEHYDGISEAVTRYNEAHKPALEVSTSDALINKNKDIQTDVLVHYTASLIPDGTGGYIYVHPDDNWQPVTDTVKDDFDARVIVRYYGAGLNFVPSASYINTYGNK